MREVDLAVTPESAGDLRQWGVNLGVLALRCNAQVRQFVSHILNAMILEGQWDQFAFNSLIPKSGLKSRVLPFTFANGRVPIAPNSVLYHATCTVPIPGKSSLELKMEALKKAVDFFTAHRTSSATSQGPQIVSH